MQVHRLVTTASSGTMMAQASEQSESTMQLEASLPDWCVLTWRHVLVCGCFVAMYLYFSYLPIPVSSTWHDVWTGGVIANQGLYQVDPSLPLAEGMRNHADGWLGRIIIHQLFQRGGLELLSFSFAVLQTLTVAMWALLLVRVSGRWWASLLAVGAALSFGWQLDGVTTLTLGQLCFAIFACLLFGDANQDNSTELFPSVLHWAAVLSTMMFWTNVDGSFVLGWVIVALILVARICDLLARSNVDQSLVKVLLSDQKLKQLLILLEICVLVAFVNPTGWKLHQVLLWWPDQPTWQALGGWQPLSLASFQGLVLAVAWAFWLMASRYAGRIEMWQWLLPSVGTILVATCQPALVWGVPMILLAGCSMMPAMTSENPKPAAVDQQVPLRFGYTLVCGLLVWVGFALSPSSYLLLGGQGRSVSQLLSLRHPTDAIAFLQLNEDETQSNGLLWCPNYWSDCLQTPARVTPVFANQNMFALPGQVQADYHTIFRGQDNWRKLLDQYDVDRMMIDKERQPRLLRNLRRQPGEWKLVHEDSKTVVLTRRTTS